MYAGLARSRRSLLSNCRHFSAMKLPKVKLNDHPAFVSLVKEDLSNLLHFLFLFISILQYTPKEIVVFRHAVHLQYRLMFPGKSQLRTKFSSQLEKQKNSHQLSHTPLRSCFRRDISDHRSVSTITSHKGSTSSS
jgi:hypothetical protein